MICVTFKTRNELVFVIFIFFDWESPKTFAVNNTPGVYLLLE